MTQDLGLTLNFKSHIYVAKRRGFKTEGGKNEDCTRRHCFPCPRLSKKNFKGTLEGRIPRAPKVVEKQPDPLVESLQRTRSEDRVVIEEVLMEDIG